MEVEFWVALVELILLWFLIQLARLAMNERARLEAVRELLVTQFPRAKFPWVYGGRRPMVKTAGCEPVNEEFESPRPPQSS